VAAPEPGRSRLYAGGSGGGSGGRGGGGGGSDLPFSSSDAAPPPVDALPLPSGGPAAPAARPTAGEAAGKAAVVSEAEGLQLHLSDGGTGLRACTHTICPVPYPHAPIPLPPRYPNPRASGYKGVYATADGRRYRARVYDLAGVRKEVYLGSFGTAVEAAVAYARAVAEGQKAATAAAGALAEEAGAPAGAAEEAGRRGVRGGRSLVQGGGGVQDTSERD